MGSPDLDAAIGAQGDLGLATLDHQLTSAGDAQHFRLRLGARRVEQPKDDGVILIAFDKAKDDAAPHALCPGDWGGHPHDAGGRRLAIAPLNTRQSSRVH